jgi:hypothetical protein
LRFDLYSGNFTKNDQLTVSPFTDAFLYIPNVTAGVANMVLPALNNAGANQRREYTERETELYRRGYVDMKYRAWLEDMAARTSEVERRAAANLTLGYVTKDSCPGVGDDTITHRCRSFQLQISLAQPLLQCPMTHLSTLSLLTSLKLNYWGFSTVFKRQRIILSVPGPAYFEPETDTNASPLMLRLIAPSSLTKCWVCTLSPSGIR